MPGYRWNAAEIATLIQHFPRAGVVAASAHLPRRTPDAITSAARRLKLRPRDRLVGGTARSVSS